MQPTDRRGTMPRTVKQIKAHEILSTSAQPTIETAVTLDDGTIASASVPYGTSAGKYEAVTLTDKDPGRYRGKGMLKAAANVNDIIAPKMVGVDATDQKDVDGRLVALDPTPQRSELGGNSILSVSLACARAGAKAKRISLHRHIRECYGLEDREYVLPKPMVVVIEGGQHADNSTDLQEYLVGVTKDRGGRENVRAAIETYLHLKPILKKHGFNTNVGTEGAYAPAGIKSNSDPLTYIEQAMKAAGYEPGEDLGIALDPAASEFFEDGNYNLACEGRTQSSDEMIAYYEDLVGKFCIFSVEDGLGEDDWDAWPVMNSKLGNKIMVMGDDLTVTNVERLQKAIDIKAINSILIKPNQVGTLSETVEAMELARANGFKTIVSHRGGGETTDTLIIDLAVAAGAQFVKVGPSRGERVIKYNRLMAIADELGL
jgi:enolase